MEPIKTTEELLEILHQEQMACVKGERVFPLGDNADEMAIAHGGLLGAFLGGKGMVAVATYHSFRDAVREYQLKHNISGLSISEISLNGKTHRFPVPEDQLLILDSDMEILKLAKDAVVQAFVEYCEQNSPVYISHLMTFKDHSEYCIETTLGYVKHFADSVQWAVLGINDEDSGLCGHGISIELGWGDPTKAPYRDNKEADSMFFHAESRCPWSAPVVAERASMSIEDIVEWRKKRDEQ
jgi:hypothetical protein